MVLGVLDRSNGGMSKGWALLGLVNPDTQKTLALVDQWTYGALDQWIQGLVGNSRMKYRLVFEKLEKPLQQKQKTFGASRQKKT